MADDAYDQVLQSEARDLVALAKSAALPEVDFRDELVASALVVDDQLGWVCAWYLLGGDSFRQ